ncbi:D-alanyl-D-alanine carboxypeptidase family protein [Mesobacterium pallidum]|uniref:D-alanyl-D-alanine carboxypeptidase family protein n=1 Tax=Mesobacterium pallidum TaxID=2872037 RepID=UPI001EE37341|nr:D-alanyl-D-alanine carboxypeptidase family protein [Mesobacterium pallidum]
MAAPYAALVMDARTGEVLHARNADTRLHPASLTKMMTLYITFQAVEAGELDLDQYIRISPNAAAEPPSKLGLQSGQKIKLRYLIRAAAVKSANDAATALGEAVAGSEAAFARRMNRTAKALGMTRTTFKNAHGLTETGHMSTARDMTILGRHLLYDYPQYYNLFSRMTADAGIKTVPNTNRRFLSSYKGADGIKTGYTRAAGFNLVASAERGQERIIATVFGGRSSAQRNAEVAELLDLGFKRAPSTARVKRPDKPDVTSFQADPEAMASATGNTPGGVGKTVRVNGLVKVSLRPQARPGTTEVPAPMLMAQSDVLKEAVAEAKDVSLTVAETVEAAAPEPAPVQVASVMPGKKPPLRPEGLALVSVAAAAPIATAITTAAAHAPGEEEAPRVVERVSTSGGRHWGINIGSYPSRYAAEKVLLKTALAEMDTLDGSLRKVVQRRAGFDANFLGMTRESADLACRRLQARNVTCFMVGPG